MILLATMALIIVFERVINYDISFWRINPTFVLRSGRGGRQGSGDFVSLLCNLAEIGDKLC